MVLTRWTNEITSQFISLYEEQECLWKSNSLTYRDREAREEALHKILIGMDLPYLTLDDVKKKIKYLRSTYMVEVNKIEKSVLSGSNVIYTPCLQWFDQMNAFIKSVLIKSSSRRKEGKEVNLDSITETSDQQSQDEEESMINEMITVKSEICEPEDCPPELEEFTIEPLRERKRELYLTIKPPESSSSKIARIEQVSTVVNKPKTSLNLKERIKEETTNEFDIFGKYVAVQLKSLYEEDAILAQDEIQSILTRYKLKKVRQKSDNFMQSYNANTPKSYTSDYDPSYPNDRLKN